ncbi:MAG TPA: dUTP diphosphatase, partial [candidate division WOR-3 bacterium]|nr:dUTP diphosphatase [candidate division WOR-3 bacterium]
MSEAVVLVHRLHPGVTLPERRTDHAAGFDLAAAEPALVPARGRAAVGTGLALQLPPGVEAQVRPRSGLALHHGIGILNAPGTIDPDYRGEVKVILFNTNDEPFRVEPGRRIA